MVPKEAEVLEESLRFWKDPKFFESESKVFESEPKIMVRV